MRKRKLMSREIGKGAMDLVDVMYMCVAIELTLNIIVL